MIRRDQMTKDKFQKRVISICGNDLELSVCCNEIFRKFPTLNTLAISSIEADMIINSVKLQILTTHLSGKQIWEDKLNLPTRFAQVNDQLMVKSQDSIDVL